MSLRNAIHCNPDVEQLIVNLASELNTIEANSVTNNDLNYNFVYKNLACLINNLDSISELNSSYETCIVSLKSEISSLVVKLNAEKSKRFDEIISSFKIQDDAEYEREQLCSKISRLTKDIISV